MLLHFIASSNGSETFPRKQQGYDSSSPMPSTADLAAHIAESCKMVSTSYGLFKSKAAEQVSRNQHIMFFVLEAYHIAHGLWLCFFDDALSTSPKRKLTFAVSFHVFLIEVYDDS